MCICIASAFWAKIKLCSYIDTLDHTESSATGVGIGKLVKKVKKRHTLLLSSDYHAYPLPSTIPFSVVKLT